MKFTQGQRAFISKLHFNCSIDKKQRFKGRVVTILDVHQYDDGNRYYVALAINDRYTMHIGESYLEPLVNQPLEHVDQLHLRAESAKDVVPFDEKRLPLPNAQTLLWEAYSVLDHGEQHERLSMLEKLENYFKRVGKPT